MDSESYEVKSVNADEVADAIAQSGESRISPRRRRLLRAIEDTKKSIGGGDLYHIEFDDLDVLFVRPSKNQFNEATGTSAENKKRAPEALNRLAMQIVKFPDPESFRTIVDEFSGVGMTVANDAIALASKQSPDLAKKV